MAATTFNIPRTLPSFIVKVHDINPVSPRLTLGFECLQEPFLYRSCGFAATGARCICECQVSYRVAAGRAITGSDNEGKPSDGAEPVV